jgi:predicted permease
MRQSGGVPSALQDLRNAWRSVTRARALTAVLLIGLGLGTGANAAVYTAVRALLYGAVPGVGDTGTLVDIYTTQFSGAPFGPTSYPDYLSIRAAATALEDVAAYEDSGLSTAGVAGTASMVVRVTAVSEGFFTTLDMRPRVGRLPRPAGAGPREAAISSEFWTLLGQPADLTGRALRIDTGDVIIAGVLPEGFRGLHTARPADVWIPLEDQVHVSGRGHRRLSVIGRLKPGARLEIAQQEMAQASRDLAARYPSTNRGTLADPEAPRLFSLVRYSRLDPASRGAASSIATLAAGAAALLLASACVNAGALLLSRAVARKRQLAVKMALGAPRARLVRQVLLEVLLVSLAGGGLGLLFASWVSGIASAMFAPEHASLFETRLNAGLILMTVGVACCAGALFGLPPALQATSAPALIALRADSGAIEEGRGTTRIRAAFVVCQIAMSTVLLSGSALLVDALERTLAGHLGSSAHRVAVMTIEAPGAAARPELGVDFHAAARAALLKMPDVEAVGWSSTAPLGRANTRRLRVEAGAAGVIDTVDVNAIVVTPDYFQAIDLELLEGRTFDDRDRTRSRPVAIVDEGFARQYFGRTAAGQMLLDASGTELQIVGVVRVRRYRTLQESPRPTVFLPLLQSYMPLGYLCVRTRIEPRALLPSIAAALERVDSRVQIRRAATLEDHVSEALVFERLTTRLVGLCGLLALVMATIGVYGVMGDAVRRRTREIGLRVALGAGRAQVARLVFSEVVVLTVAGFGAGAGAVLMLTRAAQAVVFGTGAPDATALAAAPALLAIVVLLAAIVPLRRALGVNATIALRAE